MKTLILSFLSLFAVALAHAQVWYVSGSGDDKNDGKTPQTSFRTLQRAADVVDPGDEVLIDTGIYTGNGGDVVRITRSGTPDAWITWKTIPGRKAEIHPDAWGGVVITGSYHILDGLVIVGKNDSLALKHAIEDSRNEQPNPVFNTNGILVDGRKNPAGKKPHHIVIRNCTVAKCSGGGITGLQTDYVTIEDCKVYNNAWFMRYAGSGITFLNNWAFDEAPGYHIVIQRNLVWNNKTLVPWERTGNLSDGNGILLDVTDRQGSGATNPDDDAAQTGEHVVKKTDRPLWKNRSLIANNISAYNGGSGIHVFRTAHVDIINNVTYWNGCSVDYEELFPNRSNDIVILNNIIVPRPGGRVTSDNRNTNIRWDYNIYPVAQNVFRGEHDIVADPMFADPQIDLSTGDFRLKKGSPALDSGTGEVPLKEDITGKKRPRRSGVDRGAFEQ